MFSSFWSTLQAPFNRPKSIPINSEDLEVEKQIFSELEVAAKPGMVATRSQEPGIVADFEESLPNGTSKSESAKKRSWPDPHADPDGSRVSKRRKQTTKENTVSQKNGYERLPIPVVAPSTNISNIPRDGIEVRIVNSIKPKLLPPESLAYSGGKGVGHPSEQEATRHTTKEPRSRPLSHEIAAGSSSPRKSFKAPRALENKQSSPAIASATHKRFGSEGLQEEQPLASDNVIGISTKVQVDTESENEAPETLTASKGFNQARSAANEVAKIAELQRTKDKQKRRDRDARLKLQAKSARPSKRKSLGLTSETDSPISPSTLVGSINESYADNEARLKAPRKPQLPVLLPDEILNAEPTARPSAPPPESTSIGNRTAKKRQLLNVNAKPPKDIRRGPVTIRVLDSGPGIMPPKVSKESKMLREAWLTGQRGSKGGIERRKTGGGFVRRV